VAPLERDRRGDADPDGFAYRRLHNRWHTVLQTGLDTESIGNVLTRIGARAQLGIRPTGLSPRRGLVTDWSGEVQEPRQHAALIGR
jgi:hypothetical protein